jgi:magnesium transporter
VLDLYAGGNVVLTSHALPLAFLEELRGGDDEGRGGRAELGRLSAESFTATVLDAHLSTYFDAVSAFEMAVERLEMEIFDDRRQECLGELRELRRAASRLRRMLTPHRAVFAALSRPDFRPDGGKLADRHFQALDLRFERAMDMVENCRDLVMGSFDLFSNQTALRMNRTMYVLTFATVVLGLMAVVVGAFGMNFETRVFDVDHGFGLTVGALSLLGLGALLFARLRRWF